MDKNRSVFSIILPAFQLSICLFAGISFAEQHHHTGTLSVAGTEFQFQLENGQTLKSNELVGSILTVNQTTEIRIDDVKPDPEYPEILFHSLSIRQNGKIWKNACNPDINGIRLGFPLPGKSQRDGSIIYDNNSFEIVCTAGARAKCIRAGYAPADRLTNLKISRAMHQTCVRMMRADYCGDGSSNTVDGIKILFTDRNHLQQNTYRSKFGLEAVWNESGAICVNHVRVPGLISLTELQNKCPKLHTSLSNNYCQKENAVNLSGALLFSFSQQQE